MFFLLEFRIWGPKSSWVLYLVVGESDGRVKHRPEDALVARRRGEGALVSEEVVQVLGEHGAHVQVGCIHGLTCPDIQVSLKHLLKCNYPSVQQNVPAYLILPRLEMKSL